MIAQQAIIPAYVNGTLTTGDGKAKIEMQYPGELLALRGSSSTPMINTGPRASNLRDVS